MKQSVAEAARITVRNAQRSLDYALLYLRTAASNTDMCDAAFRQIRKASELLERIINEKLS